MVISNSEDILEKEGNEYLDEFGMMEGEYDEEDF